MKRLIFSITLLAVVGTSGPAKAASGTNQPLRLTLQEAEKLVMQNNPRMTSAQLKALAAGQVPHEVRSAFFPLVAANVTAVGTGWENTRIAAGAINNPSIFERNAEGLSVSQLITDFGRTANLSASAAARARAEEKTAEATRGQILLQAQASFFSALEAQSVLGVARQTVQTRKVLFDQVQELSRNKLKSDLDLSFAQVNLEEGKLLLAKAQNDLKAALASLSSLLGHREEQPLELVEEPAPGALTNQLSDLITSAIQQHPELARLRFEKEAAEQLARAESKLFYPTISAFGAAGVVPVRDAAHLPDKYAAAGVNLNLPLFTGGLYTARKREAELKAKAAEATVRDEENNVVRDVQIAKLNSDYAWERVALTAKLAAHATQAFELAQARYNLGSTSITELSQAQLNKTSADIAEAAAKYHYQVQRAILDFQTGQTR